MLAAVHHPKSCHLSCLPAVANPSVPTRKQLVPFTDALYKRARRRGRRAGAAGRLNVQAISMPRSWHAFRMDLRYSWVNVQDQFWSLPFIAAAVQRWKQIQRPIVETYLRLWTIVQRWGQDRLHEYDDFCTQENMREWKWRRKNEAEWDMWRRIVLGAVGVMFTVIWEAIVPTSVFWALIPPLWAAWTLYDNWIQSPFMLGLLIMLPLKFPPFGPWRWF